ncbi:hypothetical protein BGX31_007215 [Mortierella sp. GBA43]|nr:hypothetical protein BGX31_007215 [Mortierella sp. GBA43]
MIPLQPVSQEGSSSPSVKKTLPPLLPSPSIAPANSNGSTSTAVCDGTSTAPPDAALLNLPGTEGMTVVRNEEGAIMVYNPQTDVMTFRCELCPSESFGRIHDLKRHQTSKHQEMTWPCDFCHRPFVRRDALLRHYTVKSARDDGLHPAAHEVDKLMAARARAKITSMNPTSSPSVKYTDFDVRDLDVAETTAKVIADIAWDAFGELLFVFFMNGKHNVIRLENDGLVVDEGYVEFIPKICHRP